MARPILFCHGLESAPIGRKSQALIDGGYSLTAPDCRGKDLPERVALITAAIVAGPRDMVVVGSSFGGIAGLVATIVAAQQQVRVHGLILCAPALQLPPPPGTTTDLSPVCPTEIIHGTGDDVIPIELSRRFAQEHDTALVEVDDAHGLGGTGLKALQDAVHRFAD